MQTSYTNDQIRGLIGDVATLRPHIKRARVYAKRKQITTIGVGGATDGTYIVRVLSRAPNRPIDNVDSSFVASSSSADLIGAGLATQINSKTELRNLLRAAYNASTDEIVLTAVRTGESFEISFPSNPGSNLTQSATQSPVVSNLPLGVGMVSTDGDTASRPSSTSANLFGVVARGRGIEAPDDGSAEYHSAGDTLELLTEGDIYVESEENVASEDDPVYMRVVASGSGIQGAFRTTPDGTAQVLTITPAANMGIYGFSYSYRDANGVVHRRQPIYMPTDATTSTDDAVDGLEDAAADDAPTGIAVSTASASTTLTLTAAAGTEIFDVATEVWHNDTEVVSVAASLAAYAGDTVLIPRSKAKWLRPASGNTSADRCAALQLFGG